MFDRVSTSESGNARKLKMRKNLENLFLEHSDKTQQQIAELWGDNLTQQNVSYACQKLGITRKKKRMAIKKEMKKNEQDSSKN